VSSVHLRYVTQFLICLYLWLFYPKFTIFPFQNMPTCEPTQACDTIWKLGTGNSISCTEYIRPSVRLGFITCPTLTCLCLIYFFFLFWWYWVWIQGLILARQVLYLLSNTSSPPWEFPRWGFVNSLPGHIWTFLAKGLQMNVIRCPQLSCVWISWHF
jgi:hypothetical protein